MGDRIIVTDDEPKPQPDVLVVKEQAEPKVEEVVKEEKTTVVEERKH